MTRPFRWPLRLASAAAVVLGTSASAAGQTVLVHLVDTDTSRPLVGAIAHLVTPAGEVVASRLSDRNGRALFTDIDAGRYLVRAEMLGHGTGESDSFSVLEQGAVPLVLQLEPRPIVLTGVEVTAEAGPCETRPSEEGRLLADVWGEARKALSAAAVTDRQGVYRYALVTYEQELDGEGAIVDERRTERQGYMRSPFATRDIEELTREGFVQRTAAEWTYYAPDAQSLLSDPFLDTHCFRLVEGNGEQLGLVGLAFEPTGENEEVSDISGTLWLDRDSVHIRWLEYTYENLEPDVRPGDATGRVEFRRMPEGTWIVPEWWIRMPVVEVDASRPDGRRRIVGLRQTGGRVQEIVEAGGRELVHGDSAGAIEGVVVDSLGAPIQGVRVGWIGSNQRIYTDVEGRFNLPGLMEGTYRLAFLDPDLEALGFEPPETTREVGAGVSSFLELHMPSPADLLRERCGVEAAPGTSVLGGIVRNADTDAPIAGATVRVLWSGTDIDAVGGGAFVRETFSGFETTTDGFGVYRFCAIPRRAALTLVSLVDGVAGSEETFAIPADSDARMHVIRHAPSPIEAHPR